MQKIKNIFRNLVIRYRLVNIIYARFLNLLNFRTKKEILSRAKMDLFDYKDIAKPLGFCPIDLVVDNNYYGLSFSFQNYIGKYGYLSTYIEHGLFIGEHIREDSLNWHTSSILTFSNYRKNILKKYTNKEIITVGPYIHYAENYISLEEMNVLRKKLGKVLLVFPSHSIKNINAVYDEDFLIKEIDKIKEDFDTVMICLYWRDTLNLKLVEKYEEQGYIIVSAGNIYDSNFLSRLKSIITLSKFTISNFVGTHIGYCVYLNKPHMLIKQETNYQSSKISELVREFDRGDRAESSADRIEKKLYKVFEKYKDEIDTLQYSVASNYWGFAEIKTKQELQNCLLKE